MATLSRFRLILVIFRVVAVRGCAYLQFFNLFLEAHLEGTLKENETVRGRGVHLSFLLFYYLQ